MARARSGGPTLGPVSLHERIPEPELMEEPEQARAYAGADFSEPHQAVAAGLVAALGGRPAARVVDLGCGPADVTVRVARALPDATVVGIDAGPVMLGLGRARVAREGMAHRVVLVERRLPSALHDLGRFDTVVSNSLLHHLSDPTHLWEAVHALGAPGATVHVVDLCRPARDEDVEVLVERHMAGAPDVLVADFRASLRAAYRPPEVEGQLARAGLGGLRVRRTTDRHLVVSGRLPTT